MKNREITEEEIETQKTRKGGWTSGSLAQWGVTWPPPKNWKKQLLRNGVPLRRDDDKDVLGETGYAAEEGLAKHQPQAYIKCSTDSSVETERPGWC